MSVSIPTLGVAIVDHDHREAVKLIEQAQAAEDSQLAALMAKAATHLSEHFAREEALMDECGFFAANCHKEEHQRVLKEAHAVQTAGDAASIRAYLTRAFPDWLVSHANSMDQVTMTTYLSYLASHTAKAS